MTEGELFGLLRARVAERGRASLCVMGGTFDPPHVGHTALADAVARALGLDATLYVPAGAPAFKLDRATAPARDRLAMTSLAAGGRPDSAVSAREVVRPGTTYTVDTLVELAAAVPAGVRLVFAVGADSLETLPLWRDPARIARLAEIAAVPRPGHDAAAACEALGRSGLGFTVHLVEADLPRVSSTLVRARLAAGEGVADLLDPVVERYIRRRGLYGARP